MSAPLTLEGIWRTSNDQVIQLLLKSGLSISSEKMSLRLDRITLAEAFLKTDYLTTKDRQLVENSNFKDFMIKYPFEKAIRKLQQTSFGLLNQYLTKDVIGIIDGYRNTLDLCFFRWGVPGIGFSLETKATTPMPVIDCNYRNVTLQPVILGNNIYGVNGHSIDKYSGLTVKNVRIFPDPSVIGGIKYNPYNGLLYVHNKKYLQPELAIYDQDLNKMDGYVLPNYAVDVGFYEANTYFLTNETLLCGLRPMASFEKEYCGQLIVTDKYLIAVMSKILVYDRITGELKRSIMSRAWGDMDRFAFYNNKIYVADRRINLDTLTETRINRLPALDSSVIIGSLLYYIPLNSRSMSQLWVYNLETFSDTFIKTLDKHGFVLVVDSLSYKKNTC
jgi:hypothetical protein